MNQSSVQALLLPSTIEPTSSMEVTQDQTQLESESLSEKADLECDEKEKLSEVLASCDSGENSMSNRGTSEIMLTSSGGEFSPPVVTSKSQNIPPSSSAVLTPPSLPLSVVSNATNVVPNVTSNVGSDTNLTDSNMEAVLMMNSPSTHIPTPGAMSAQLTAGGTAPASPLSTPITAVKSCEYLSTCARFKSALGLPGKNEIGCAG